MESELQEILEDFDKSKLVLFQTLHNSISNKLEKKDLIIANLQRTLREKDEENVQMRIIIQQQKKNLEIMRRKTMNEKKEREEKLVIIQAKTRECWSKHKQKGKELESINEMHKGALEKIVQKKKNCERFKIKIKKRNAVYSVHTKSKKYIN